MTPGRRVISLLPAATEMVWALEAGHCLVARSHECEYPESVRNLPVVTGTSVDAGASGAEIHSQVAGAVARGEPLFRLDAVRIRALKPEVILTQGQCAVCAVSPSELETVLAGFPGAPPDVVSLSPATFPDLWTDLRRVGAALGLPDEGRHAIAALKGRLVNVIQRVAEVEHRPRVACLEWLDPLMGAGHWIPELVTLAGGLPVCGQAGKPSGVLLWQDLERAAPEVVVVMPCGLDLGRACQEWTRCRDAMPWDRLPAGRNGRIVAADGNAYFNRPGPRLVDSIEILAEILHPELFPHPAHLGQGWRPVPVG